MMVSPRRPMTRARAKKEGYEPDWRINPNWKTPKKTKTTRFVLPDNDDVGSDDDENAVNRASLLGRAQRVPSPVKIRIPAKVTSQSQSGSSSSTASTLPKASLDASVSARNSILGSPVRVRPRTSKLQQAAEDKENSPSATMLAAWTASGKAAIPRTPGPASRATPLAPSPSSANTLPQPPPIKVLATPIRVVNPQTPGRNLGSARRIPLTIDKKKGPPYKLDPIADVPCPESHRGVSSRINPRPTSPLKQGSIRQNAPSLAEATASAKGTEQRTALQRNKSSNLNHKPTSASAALALDDQLTPDSPHWIPLKTIPTLHRPSLKTSDPLARPVKPPTESTSRPVTKRDFYVDESLSAPLQSEKAAKRSSSSIPKFPIRRRSVSQTSTPTSSSTPKSRVTSTPVHFDSLEELKPVNRADKWKTPVKGRVHNVEQSIRKVCFRTPSMENLAKTKEIPRSRPRPLSILTLATPQPSGRDSPDVSTTPSDTPQSPKVFDLSDAEDPAFDLFTPLKSKLKTPNQTESKVELDVPIAEEPETIPSTSTMTADACIIREPTFDLLVPKKSGMKSTHTAKGVVNHASHPLYIPKGPSRPPTRHRDISVPLKDDIVDCPIVELKANVEHKTPTSVKSARSDKESKRPLRGVVAFVDVRTADGDEASAPFADALKNLGARVVKQWTWNGDEIDKVGITHVIFKQGGPRTLSKVKWAKGAVKCVGLGWISQCEAEGQKVDESLFQVEMPTGQYGHKRRKSMEPRALANASSNSTPFKDQKDISVPVKDTVELDTTQRALSELSLNTNHDSMTPLQSVSLQLARRKSFQHVPVVSSPLARKSWTIPPQFPE